MRGRTAVLCGRRAEMTETRFPEGYGVRLAKGDHLMSIVVFYHKAPITKDVMATFTMYMAPDGASVKEMDVYQVGVNIVCFSKFSQRGLNQTDEGIEITTEVQVHKAPLKFRMDGRVKFAYPHGHDELLMIGLDNMTKKQGSVADGSRCHPRQNLPRISNAPRPYGQPGVSCDKS